MSTELQHGWPTEKAAHEPRRTGVLKATICEETARQCAAEFGDPLRGMVLTGSLARDEATFLAEGQRCKLLGDAEFLLVFHERTALPSAPSLNVLSKRIENGLFGREILGHIALSAVHPAYLRKLRPHIFAYELRTCGQVIWGDSEILSLIPAFSPSDIPLEDAWRLLCNRMIEQLEVLDGLVDRPETLPPTVYYRTVKLYLDMATSLLVFLGAYEPSYRKRAEKLKELAESELPEKRSPFPLPGFAERVAACTRVKVRGFTSAGLSEAAGHNGVGFAYWEEAVEYARLLWRWESGRLTDTHVQLSNRALWERWMQRQPVSVRLRGWLCVLRKQGWHKSWREWFRWGRRSCQASPRYWVYAAASELFFRLPCLLQQREEKAELNADWEALSEKLPVVRRIRTQEGRPIWLQLASEVVWNYHEFLVDTRS